jgi:hypothetical protein
MTKTITITAPAFASLYTINYVTLYMIKKTTNYKTICYGVGTNWKQYTKQGSNWRRLCTRNYACLIQRHLDKEIE